MTQDEMIELLKQTLEAFEIAAEGGRVHFHSYAEALRQAIAELESQEPVKYEHKAYTMPPQPEQKTLADDFFKTIADKNPKPFPPSQREWVGLTDEEINEWTPEIHSVIQAIEAKLKGKNEPTPIKT